MANETTKATHSPRPWVYDVGDIHAGTGRGSTKIAQTYDNNGKPYGKNPRDDGELMALAPEMLAALRAVADPDVPESAARAAARHLIARAEGRTS